MRLIIGKIIARYKQAVIIYNPHAGRFRRKGASLLESARTALGGCCAGVIASPTTGPRTAGEIARKSIETGADVIIAAGGDGTINEVAAGMIGASVPLAVLPAGTANVLANEMGIPDWNSAASAIGDSIPHRISVGEIESTFGKRSFLLMAGAGVDAHVVYHVSAPLKAKLGKIAYWVAGFSLLGLRFQEFEVEVDGTAHSCSFALISKVRNYGGDLEIARDTSLFDDQFEIVLFSGRESIRYLKYLSGVALRRLKGMGGVTIVRGSDVRLSCAKDRRVYVQVDGEYAGHLPGRVQIVRDAVTLLIPPCYYAKVGRTLPSGAL